jgi:hypothetical protein
MPDHGGIVVCSIGADFSALANRIHDAVSLLHPDLAGMLVRVNRPNQGGPDA